MRSATQNDDDRTARARIRDAALDRFSRQGVDGATLREIAADAGVSPALVLHHFGSKTALRAACDEYVVRTIRVQKLDALRQGPQLDPLAAIRAQTEGPPVIRYLARTLSDASPGISELVDGMVEVAMTSFEEGVRSGVMKPVEHTGEVAAVLTLWSLGLLVLHEHAARLLGADLMESEEGRARYTRIALEALGEGLFTAEALERVRDSLGLDDEAKGHGQ